MGLLSATLGLPFFRYRPHRSTRIDIGMGLWPEVEEVQGRNPKRTSCTLLITFYRPPFERQQKFCLVLSQRLMFSIYKTPKLSVGVCWSCEAKWFRDVTQRQTPSLPHTAPVPGIEIKWEKWIQYFKDFSFLSTQLGPLWIFASEVGYLCVTSAHKLWPEKCISDQTFFYRITMTFSG